MTKSRKLDTTPLKWTCAWDETVVVNSATCPICNHTWWESDDKWDSMKAVLPGHHRDRDNLNKPRTSFIGWNLTLIPIVLALFGFISYSGAGSFFESGTVGFLLAIPSIIITSVIQWILLRQLYPKASRWILLNTTYSILVFLITLAYFVGGIDTSTNTSASLFSYVSLAVVLSLWLLPNFYAGFLISKQSSVIARFFYVKTNWDISFWNRWLSTPLLGLIGLVLTLIVISSLANAWVSGIPASIGAVLIYGLWGGFTGLLQSLFLRHRLKNAWWLVIANMAFGAIPWGNPGSATTGLIFVVWILSFLILGPFLAWKVGSISFGEDFRKIFLKGIAWGVGGALLGILQAYIHFQATQPKPPPNAVEIWYTNLTTSLSTWWNNIWLVHFIGQNPGTAFLYALGLFVVCAVIIASLTDSKDPSKNSSVISIISLVLAGSAILGIISAIVWVIHWVNDRLTEFKNWVNSGIPGLPQFSAGWDAWRVRHDPSGYIIWIAIAVSLLVWYVQAVSFSRYGKYNDNDLFTNNGRVAGIIQVPFALLIGFYTFFVFPTASFAVGALTTGVIALTYGWFFHTSTYLLNKDYGPLQTAASGGPFAKRLLILSLGEILTLMALLFGMTQAVGVNRTIYANQDWQPTNVTISAGDVVVILNTWGSWSADPNNPELPFVGGEGYADGAIAHQWTAYSFAPLGSLLASVGMGPSMDIYNIGRINIVSTRQYGEIYLKMNDYYVFDNAGSLHIWLLDITKLIN